MKIYMVSLFHRATIKMMMMMMMSRCALLAEYRRRVQNKQSNRDRKQADYELTNI